MKAEHRKELETNLLADRMGVLIQKMKGGPNRSWMMYAFVIVLVLIVGFITYRFWVGNPTEAASRWIKLDLGEVIELADDGSNNNTSKAAKLQVAHYCLWSGVRLLAAMPVPLGNDRDQRMGGLDYIYQAKEIYSRLERDCENDKEWLAEAKFGLAVADESFAAVDIKNFDKAKEQYEAVADQLPDTYHGALAKARAKELTDKDKGPKLLEFYKDLNKRFDLAGQEKLRAMLAQLRNKMPPRPEPKQPNP